MNPDSKPFPIYQLQDAFEAFCNSEPAAKPQHRSLYYFLLGYCRRRGNTPRFSLAYEAGMHGSGIGSWATYDAALKALAEWGFIAYTPGANRYKVPVVELTFRNPTDDVLLTYWQSYCLSTANPTDDVLATQLVTLKEELKKEREEVGKLKNQLSSLRSEPAADAAASAPKKIEEAEALQSESPAPADASASHTRGAADVGTRKARPHAYDPAAIHPGLVLPFDTDSFRQLWAGYKQYREEQKFPRFSGGMMEQEALRTLSNLAAGNEDTAHELIAQAIRKGWKDIYKLDEQRTDRNPQRNAVGSVRGEKPTVESTVLAGSLAERRWEQRHGGAGNPGPATGPYPGSGPAEPAGLRVVG